MASFQGTKINPTQFHKSQLKFYLILIPLSIFMLLPIVYIFSSAFKPISELFAFPPTFLVRKPTTSNFVYLFYTRAAGIPKTRFLFNSFFVTIAILASSVIISAMAGYALSKKKFRVRNAFFEINTLALMFVPTAVLIPRFLVISELGIMNTFWGHILPIISMPVCLFLLKQFIDQIPDAIIESAHIDGANEFTVFTQVVMPMISPAIATVAILSFQMAWNSPDSSKFFIDSEALKTFAFYVSTLTSTGNTVAGTGMAAAAALIMFLPNLIIFIFMQNKVMNTMAHSGLK